MDLTDSASMESSLTIAVRSSFAVAHVLNAGHHAKGAHTLEERLKNGERDDLTVAHRASVTAAVVLSAAFLEAVANEFYIDALEVAGEVIKRGLSQADVERISALWPSVSRTGAFEKFSIALITLGKAAFDRGKQPLQDAALVFALRNGLMHPEPASGITYSSDSDVVVKPQDMEKKFGTKGLSPNPFSGGGSLYFPDRLLSYGCAAWALRAAVAFADEFHHRVGIKPPYDHVRGAVP